MRLALIDHYRWLRKPPGAFNGIWVALPSLKVYLVNLEPMFLDERRLLQLLFPSQTKRNKEIINKKNCRVLGRGWLGGMALNAPSGFLSLFTQATPVLSEVLEFLPVARDVVSVLLVSRRLFLVKRDDFLHALLLKRFAAAWGSRDALSKAKLPTSFPRDDTLNLLQRSLSTDPVLISPTAQSGAHITTVSAECQYQYSQWLGFRHRPCQGCNCFPILPERWSCFHCGADLCKACRLQHPPFPRPRVVLQCAAY